MTETSRGILFGVSVGPGDPELLTLKAVRVIRSADVIAIPDAGHGPGTAYRIAKEHLTGKELLTCPTPMSNDADMTARAHELAAESICSLLAQGKDVAYLCLGDVSVYSSYHHVQRLVVARGFGAQVIPGVTSFCAAAARLGVPLCSGDERLLIAPLATADTDELLDLPANKALLKPQGKVRQLRQALEQRGMLEHATLVERCGMPDERILPRLERADDAGYLSVVIVGSKGH